MMHISDVDFTNNSELNYLGGVNNVKKTSCYV